MQANVYEMCQHLLFVQFSGYNLLQCQVVFWAMQLSVNACAVAAP